VVQLGLVEHHLFGSAALAQSPRSSRALLIASDFMWWGGGDLGTLTAGPAEFDLRFHGASIDLGVHNRLWIRHFRVVGNAFRASNPRRTRRATSLTNGSFHPGRTHRRGRRRAAAAF
jgi:hypothetical protein